VGLREGARWLMAAAAFLSACAEFGEGSGGSGGPDAAGLVPVDDGAPGPDARLLGTRDMPAADCAELRDDGAPSGVAWVRHPDGVSPAFPVYCEQEIDGGGWALLYNSVYRADGTTTAFWQFDYASRLGRMGSAAPDENYYHGALYLIATDYIDVFTDVAGTTAIAARVSATGLDQASMALVAPALVEGNADVFNSQFAAGWSAKDHDGDSHPDGNCATLFSDVAQHYSACWNYNLGSDADTPVLDGGVGPHVNNSVLTALGLALQPEGGSYSRVLRIARFARW
jgi:hypothetical protein